jgi:hypothetical protein
MLVIIHWVVPVGTKFMALVWITVAYDVAETPFPMFLDHVFFKDLAWFINDEM